MDSNKSMDMDSMKKGAEVMEPNNSEVLNALDRLSTIGNPNGSVYMGYLNGDQVRNDDIKVIRQYIVDHNKDSYIKKIDGVYRCSSCLKAVWALDKFCWYCGAKLIGRECVVK